MSLASTSATTMVNSSNTILDRVDRPSLEAMCEQIAKMEKNHHIEILQILRNYPSIALIPKSNGFHLCADLFPPAAVEEIQKYVQYVREQENSLQEIESQKKEIRRDYFVE